MHHDSDVKMQNPVDEASPETILKQRIFAFFDELRKEKMDQMLRDILDDWEGVYSRYNRAAY
jgi:hypothetical protein